MIGAILPVSDNSEAIRNFFRKVTEKSYPNQFALNAEIRICQYAVSPESPCLKSFNQFFTAIKEGLPGYKVNIDNMIVKSDRLMICYTISGTHRKEFLGLSPNNEQMTIKCLDMFRLRNGVIVEHLDGAYQKSYRI